MINVKSEIMPLKRVLLHRPGNELLNLTPDSLNMRFWVGVILIYYLTINIIL